MATLIKIEQGTAFHSGKNLCRSCRNGWLCETTKGEYITCRYGSGMGGADVVMRNPVLKCSAYDDRAKTSLSDFYKTAFILEVDRVSNAVGFVPAKKWAKKNSDDPDAWRVSD